jgi:hypothetical protein
MGRTNKVIELLQQGQPVFSTGAPEVTYEAGRSVAIKPQRRVDPRLEDRRPLLSARRRPHSRRSWNFVG